MANGLSISNREAEYVANAEACWRAHPSARKEYNIVRSLVERRKRSFASRGWRCVSERVLFGDVITLTFARAAAPQ